MINHSLVRADWEGAKKKAMRDGFGEAILALGADERVVVLTADLGKSLRVLDFQNKYPERYFNVGVAEQNMIGIATGLALEGRIPVACSFGVFSPARSWDQIRLGVSISNTNVKIVGSHAGLSVGENGASHQALEDVAIMRVLPNVVVLSPADYTQVLAATRAMISHEGPVYMRFPRKESADFTRSDVEFEIGKSYVYREGKDVTICATGVMVWEAMRGAEELSGEGIEAEVINVSSVKPLDRSAIIFSAKKTGRVVTVEDHQIAGGMGGAVCEVLAEAYPTPVLRLGVNDRHGESGRAEELYKRFGLDAHGLHESIKKFISFTV